MRKNPLSVPLSSTAMIESLLKSLPVRFRWEARNIIHPFATMSMRNLAWSVARLLHSDESYFLVNESPKMLKTRVEKRAISSPLSAVKSCSDATFDNSLIVLSLLIIAPDFMPAKICSGGQ